MPGLIATLSEIDAAETDARALRSRYGAGAEATCEAELAGLGEHDPRRSRWRDVLRALRWIGEERGHTESATERRRAHT
jgi:hypothetical protein